MSNSITATHTTTNQNISYIDELRCGKLGFTVISVNTVAIAILITKIIIGSTLFGPIGFTCSAIIIPSMLIFNLKNYFSYILKPLEMGLGFAFAACSVSVDENTGIWTGIHANWAHFFDARLCNALKDFFIENGAKSIADLGCGMGDYVKIFRDNNLNCIGFDGNPNTPELTDNLCQVADLTQQNLVLNENSTPYDWVLSLEVGEHLPQEHEDVFLDNLTAYATDGIVLSWAKEGQGGLGHVNEQNNDYIEGKMLERGWVRDHRSETLLRYSSSPHCFWYKDTIMVYRPQ